MSRGLGCVERAIVVMFGNSFWMLEGTTIVDNVARKLQTKRTPSLEASVRRALASLSAKGIAEQRVVHGYRGWGLTHTDDPVAEKRLFEEFRFNENDIEEEESGVNRRVLAKILGMLGSGHDGEALAAARKAEAERRKSGKTWAQIFGVKES